MCRTCREAAIFLLKDFHPYIDDARPIAGTARWSASCATWRARSRRATRRWCSFRRCCASRAELEKEITVVNYGLPSLEELDQSLSVVISSVERRSALRLGLDPENRERVLKARPGLTLAEAENVFAKIAVRTHTLDVDVILDEKKQIIRSARMLEYYERPRSSSDVGGLDVLKDWLRKRRWRSASARATSACRCRKGILLIGVPGSGKSLTAKAVGAPVADAAAAPRRRQDLRRARRLLGREHPHGDQDRRGDRARDPVARRAGEGLLGHASSHRSDGGTTSRVFGSLHHLAAGEDRRRCS